MKIGRKSINRSSSFIREEKLKGLVLDYMLSVDWFDNNNDIRIASIVQERIDLLIRHLISYYSFDYTDFLNCNSYGTETINGLCKYYEDEFNRLKFSKLIINESV